MTGLRAGLLAAAAALLFWLEGVSRGIWTAGPFGLSLTTLLLGTILIGIFVLTLYASSFLVATWWGRQSKDTLTQDISGEDEIDVIVASRDEGTLLIDCINSILDQDITNAICIWLIIKDSNDTSWLHLKERFPDMTQINDTHWQFQHSKNRYGHVLFANTDPKWAKLNLALDHGKAPWLAFLDADHVAKANWLSHSTSKLCGSNYVGIQSRRLPKATPTITSAWDSWQTHAGQEIVNAALSQTERGVLFTGTTAVFKRKAISAYKFTDCLCEDTWLSHDIWSAGGRITWSEKPGSHEEVPPDAGSFMRRRRRWARAHTHSLLMHFNQIMNAPGSTWSKIFLVAHGLFYVITVTWLAVHVAWALYYALQFPAPVRLCILGFALIPALWLTLIQRPANFAQILRDTFAGLVVTFVPSTWLTVILHNNRGLSQSWSIIQLPGSSWLTPLGCLLMTLTLIPLLIGQRRYRPGHTRELLVLVLSWPWGLLLTLASAWYGLVDLLYAPPRWGRLTRGSTRLRWQRIAELLNSSQLHHQIVRWVTAGCVIFAAVLINDAVINFSDGRRLGLTSRPLLSKTNFPAVVHLRRQWSDGGVRLQIELNRPRRSSTTPLDVKIYLDGNPPVHKTLERHSTSLHVDLALDPPWSRHRLTVEADNQELVRDVAAVAIRLHQGKFEVNGEPFLIKGLVPIFPRNLTNLQPDSAFARYRQLGVNVLRLYHEPPPSWLKAARRHGLMLIDQPDGSTWNQADPNSRWSLGRLIPRYEALVKAQFGEPSSLCSNFGNEIEIGGRPASADALRGTFAKMVTRNPESLFSYSTFKLNHRYPLPLIGINTPETGHLYWHKALPLARKEMGAFYASEFGGFLSDVEETPSSIRLGRIQEQWSILNRLNAMGAIFFYSHDNWAQPQFGSWNDPFSPDFADDRRGLWDHLDRPKPELHLLARLFADLELTVLSMPQDRPVKIRIRNRRPWALHNTRLIFHNKVVAQVGTLASESHTDLLLELPGNLSGLHNLMVKATSHAGKPSHSLIELAVAAVQDVVIEPNLIKGPDGIPRLWSGQTVQTASIHDQITVNGITTQTERGRATVTLPYPAMMSALDWPATEPRSGPQSIEFRFKDVFRNRPDAWMILDGLASPTWKLVHKRTGQVLYGHLGPRRHYTEVIVDLAEVPVHDRAGPWRLDLRRSKQRQAYGQQIILQTPRILAPIPVTLGQKSTTAQPLSR